ncbi:MAG: hypothetical protein FWH08_05520 [Oscillospiraceae bacterium]|nr:hypothetical protein [Oscillospiraceae bacterium]
MRKIVFVFLIIAVLAVIGGYTFLEFRVNEIFFVTDRTETWAFGKEMVVRRLYNSGVDIDAFFDKTEQSLITAEFTEDELYAAALISGTPEFYPAFYFSTYNPESGKDIFEFSAMLRQEFAPNQTDFDFTKVNLRVEVMTDAPVISNVELRPEDPSQKNLATPVISADGRSMAVDLSGVSGYSLTLTGTGRVTFQYTYDIATSRLIPSMALEEQLLIVHANISRGPNGEFSVEYINEPYSSLEEFFY